MNRLVKYPNGSPFFKIAPFPLWRDKHGSQENAQMDRGKKRRWIAGKTFLKKSLSHTLFKKLLFATPHPAKCRMRRWLVKIL